MFIEDSIGDRVWVDLEQCRKLVDNICITFQTKPTSGQSSGEGGSTAKSSGGESTVSSSSGGGGGGGGEKEDSGGLQLCDVDVEPRYLRTLRSIHAVLH